MMITLEKATDILAKNQYVLITTTDHKVALVPTDKVNLPLSSIDAVNLNFYVVRGSESAESIYAQLQKAAEERQANDPDKLAAIRQKKYQEIRGIA